VFKNRARLFVERAVAILTQIPLKHPIAAVPNHGFGTAAWAIDAVTPANLFQQIRCATLRDERLEWNHAFVGWRVRATRARYDFQLLVNLTNNPLPKSDD
jgi:hypothetical protein